MKVLRIAAIIAICLVFTATHLYSGQFTVKKSKSKTKIRYRCYEDDIRVPCPEGFKQSPEFIEYQRNKKARRHDTSRQYYTDEDREDNRERTYYNSSDRSYYDDSIRE